MNRNACNACNAFLLFPPPYCNAEPGARTHARAPEKRVQKSVTSVTSVADGERGGAPGSSRLSTILRVPQTFGSVDLFRNKHIAASLGNPEQISSLVSRFDSSQASIGSGCVTVGIYSQIMERVSCHKSSSFAAYDCQKCPQSAQTQSKRPISARRCNMNGQ